MIGALNLCPPGVLCRMSVSSFHTECLRYLDSDQAETFGFKEPFKVAHDYIRYDLGQTE